MKVVADELAREYPQSFQACYPYHTIPPGGFANPRFYSALMVGHLLVINDERLREFSHVAAYTTSLMLLAKSVPTYFVTDEFCRAVANTELPSDFRFGELKWPLPAQLFVLPDSFVRDYYDGVNAPFLGVARLAAGIYPSELGRLPQLDIPLPNVTCETEKVIFDYPVFYDHRAPMDYNGSYPLSLGLDCVEGSPFWDATVTEKRLSPSIDWTQLEIGVEREKQLQIKATALAVKLLLCMAARPAAIEHGTLARPAKSRRGRVVYCELWNPNVIGRAYRIPREKRSTIALASSSSRHFRYRRGHYTWQAKRFKGVEFVSVENMPRLPDGALDFERAGPQLTAKFHAVHERLWIEGIISDDGEQIAEEQSQ